MTETVRQFVIGRDDDGIRLDRWFKRHLPQIGFATVSRWARTGQIRVNGKRADPADRLEAGQTLRVPPGGDMQKGEGKTRRPLTEEELALAESMVIEQDRAAIVLNMPPGLATQGGTGTHQHVDGLLDAYAPDGPRPRLVHRLDKDTSGVLLVARTPGSAAFFSKRFSGRDAKKVYWALVVGVPSVSEGFIEAPISKQPGTGGEKMMIDEENGQSAKTRYRVVERAGNSTAWVELQPYTGRTHQLRVHLAAIGHPIVGDGKYGGQAAFLTGTISRKMHLHARRLIMDHPEGDRLDVTAPLPEHFVASMVQLGFDESASDAAPDEGPPPETRGQKKQAAKAHAKQYRKERRGERRGRGDERDDGKPKARTSTRGSSKSSAKPGSRPPAKAGAKPGSRPPAKAGAKPPEKRSTKPGGPSRPSSPSRPRSSPPKPGGGKR